MSDGEKDRLGDKLRDVEKGREDKFFADRDRALIEKLKAQTGLRKSKRYGILRTCAVRSAATV